TRWRKKSSTSGLYLLMNGLPSRVFSIPVAAGGDPAQTVFVFALAAVGATATAVTTLKAATSRNASRMKLPSFVLPTCDAAYTQQRLSVSSPGHVRADP